MDLPNKKYNIILADAPWSYQNSPVKKGVFGGCASQHYNTMLLEDIKNLPVKDLADDDCVLFMWATFPLLKEAFEVIEEWGFEYKTVAFTWVKTTQKGSIAWGCGFWTRSNAEICLLAVKGKPKRIDKGVQQILMSKRGKHSAKPLEVYRRIEKLMGKLPRIELFARVNMEGWDSWGNQVPKEEQKVLKDAIKHLEG